MFQLLLVVVCLHSKDLTNHIHMYNRPIDLTILDVVLQQEQPLFDWCGLSNCQLNSKWLGESVNGG